MDEENVDDILARFHQLINKQITSMLQDWTQSQPKDGSQPAVKKFQIKFRLPQNMMNSGMGTANETNNELMENFLEALNGQFGDPEQENFLQDSLFNFDSLENGSIPEDEDILNYFEEPFTDIFETEGGADLILEMPGVEPEDIIVTITGPQIDISALSEIKNYTKHINLEFTPSVDPEIITNNGIITVHLLR